MPPPARPGDSLHDDLAFILEGGPRLIVDVGCHHGHTTLGYLNRFPECCAIAFEAEAENHRQAQIALTPYGDRVTLYPHAVAAEAGEVTFHVNSHDGTHSTLPIGELRYWAGHVGPVETRQVPAVRLDEVLAGQTVDVLQMDIQGGELEALKGAERLLSERRVKAIYLEAEIYPLYQGQPLLWDIGAFLHARGYRFYSLYDRWYHPTNPRVLSWSDALFLCEDLTQLPEYAA